MVLIYGMMTDELGRVVLGKKLELDAWRFGECIYSDSFSLRAFRLCYTAPATQFGSSVVDRKEIMM